MISAMWLLWIFSLSGVEAREAGSKSDDGPDSRISTLVRLNHLFVNAISQMTRTSDAGFVLPVNESGNRDRDKGSPRIKDDDTSAQVEQLLSGLSLEQKIGQLMMIGFGGQKLGPEIVSLLHRYHIGSVALYNRNIDNIHQLSSFIRSIRREMSAEIQPFIAIDQEGGNVVRVRTEVMVLPGAMTLGATRDPVLAFLAGQANAIDLRLLGVDMNLAPVLDINQNAQNPVINVRALGDQPEQVARMGAQFILGQQQGGIVTVAKHFPGHGTTQSDSHFALPRLELSLEQLEQSELLPFREAIAVGLDAIMTAHVQVPALDDSGLPASLSAKVINGLLRKQLGFDGLVVTDDLEMQAISGFNGVGGAAVRSILAGADVVMVIWTPRKKQEVFDTLLDAARKGTISQERIDTSVRRVLRLKILRGTIDAHKRPQVDLAGVLPNPYHERMVNAIASRGLTLVRNEGDLIPLCDDSRVLVASPYSSFLSEMKRVLPRAQIYSMPLVPSTKQRQQDVETLSQLARQQRLVVITVANPYQAWVVQQLSHQTKTPLLVVSFASPYLLQHFPNVAGYLCAYSYLPSAQRAVAAALVGKKSITGRLPVEISDRYPWGFGLSLPSKSCTRSAAKPSP